MPEWGPGVLGLGLIAFDIAVGFSLGWFVRGRREVARRDR